MTQRKERVFVLLLLSAVALLGVSCENDYSDSDAPVALVVESIEGFDGQGNVNDREDIRSTVLTLQNRSLNPDSSLLESNLLAIQLDNYQVTFTRTDGGTVTPAPFVRSLPFTVPVNGTEQIFGLILLNGYQKNEPPLRNLQFVNGGFDRETNLTHVNLRADITFFGHTLSGDRVSAKSGLYLDFFNGPVN